MTLYKSILGKYRYEMEYTLDFVPVEKLGETVKTYSNDAQVELFGNNFRSDVGEKIVPDVDINGMRCEMTLKKVDSFNRKWGLKGAKFGLYTQDGTEIKTFSTGDDGTITIKTDVKNGVILYENTVYYLMEKEAPKGYKLSDKRYYFEFVAGDINPDEDTRIENGINIKLISASNGEFEITNERISLFRLPNTGGTGVWYMYYIGLLCIGCVGVIWRYQRKKKQIK